MVDNWGIFLCPKAMRESLGVSSFRQFTSALLKESFISEKTVTNINFTIIILNVERKEGKRGFSFDAKIGLLGPLYHLFSGPTD